MFADALGVLTVQHGHCRGMAAGSVCCAADMCKDWHLTRKMEAFVLSFSPPCSTTHG